MLKFILGLTVNFRTQIASYKNKTVIYNESDKIKIFPDTHPAIISRELFQMAQDRRDCFAQQMEKLLKSNIM